MNGISIWRTITAGRAYRPEPQWSHQQRETSSLLPAFLLVFIDRVIDASLASLWSRLLIHISFSVNQSVS